MSSASSVRDGKRKHLSFHRMPLLSIMGSMLMRTSGFIKLIWKNRYPSSLMKNRVMKKKYRKILKRESQHNVNQRLENQKQNSKSNVNASRAPSWYSDASHSLLPLFPTPWYKGSPFPYTGLPASYSLSYYWVSFSSSTYHSLQ